MAICLNPLYYRRWLRTFASLNNICFEVFSETMYMCMVTNTPIGRHINSFFSALCLFNKLLSIAKKSIKYIPESRRNISKILFAFAFVVT